jgi:hypothetical protein
MATSPARLGRLFAQLLISALVIGGAVLFNLELGPLVVQGALSEGWPTTAGSIVSSQVTSEVNDDGTRMYGAEVRYRYTVDGSAHESSRISFGWMGSSIQSQAQARVDRHPVGKKVRVHYDPSRPGEAVLEPGISDGAGAAFCLLMVFNVLSLLMAVGLVSTLSGKSGRPLGGLVRGAVQSYIRLSNKGDTFALTCWLTIFGFAGVTFILGVPSMLFDWSGWVPIIGLLIVLAAVPFVAVSVYRAHKRHAYELRIDEAKGWILLPKPSPLQEPIPFASIVGLSTAPSDDSPGSVDVLLELRLPGEGVTQNTRLVCLPADEAQEVADRIRANLEPFLERGQLVRSA